jgi:AcrR family transcriptional regulator
MSSRRDDIVAAAAKVFKEKGYHQSTTEDIANEVGMLKGSLYYYIQKKEDLLYAVVEPPVRWMVCNLQEIAAMPCAAGTKVERLVAAHLETFDAHYPHIFVYLQEVAQGMTLRPGDGAGAELHRLGKQYRELVEEIIAEGVRQGEFAADLDVRMAAFGLLGMCNWMHKWYRADGHLRPSDIARTFVAILLNGLRGSNGPHREAVGALEQQTSGLGSLPGE